MYPKTLIGKMTEHDAKADLVNTGWNGTGKRISLKNTRTIIDAIINVAIDTAPTQTIPYLNLKIPTFLAQVSDAILDPRKTYKDATKWERKAIDLASRYLKNFEQ